MKTGQTLIQHALPFLKGRDRESSTSLKGFLCPLILISVMCLDLQCLSTGSLLLKKLNGTLICFLYFSFKTPHCLPRLPELKNPCSSQTHLGGGVGGASGYFLS